MILGKVHGVRSEFFLSCKFVGLKGVQPRADDITATVMSLVLLLQNNQRHTDPLTWQIVSTVTVMQIDREPLNLSPVCCFSPYI